MAGSDYDGHVRRKFRHLERAFHHVEHLLERIMALIDDLQAQVATNTDAVQSAITLLGNLKAALDAAGTDPVKLQAIKDALTSSDTALSAAIVANTPSAPTT